MIVSFNWWFGNQGTAEGSTGDHDKLAILLNMSLIEILADIPWDRSGAAGSSWPEAFESFADPPAKVYLSIGSHMPAVTSLGINHLLTSLEPLLTAPELQDTLVLALVSATDPPRLPKLYRLSKVMRNNLMLEATNAVIESWAEERGVATLDLFTMSRTAGGEMMKDPVHFWDPM